MNEHSWTKWSAIAEIISSIAILITLIYLAIQTQQNTEALFSQSQQNLFELSQEELPLWMAYPEMSVFIIDNDLEMTMEQKVQLDTLMIIALERRVVAFRQYQRGLLDEEGWQNELQIIKLLLGTERLRDWWNKVGIYSHDPDFVAEVNKHMQDIPNNEYWEALKNW